MNNDDDGKKDGCEDDETSKLTVQLAVIKGKRKI